MASRLRRLGRDLIGRNDRTFIEQLTGQLSATHDAAMLARDAVSTDRDLAEARDQMAQIAQRADEHRQALMVELSISLTSPMDREDLYRFSRSVGDVLSNLADLLVEMDLYDVAEEPLLLVATRRVEQGIGHLLAATNDILERPAQARDNAIRAKETGVRPSYQQAMAQLLTGDGPADNEVLRRRELLRRIDVVGLRLGEAADALADGAIKRSH